MHPPLTFTASANLQTSQMRESGPRLERRSQLSPVQILMGRAVVPKLLKPPMGMSKSVSALMEEMTLERTTFDGEHQLSLYLYDDREASLSPYQAR
jgi:hypothetical protein